MPRKILLIDDEPDLVDIIKTRLEISDFNVITAYDGEEGLRKLLKEKPDLVLLDLRMPKMDGYTFIKEARVNKTVKDIPIIVVTGVENIQDILKLEGVRDYIEKPFDIEILLEKIDECLGK